MTWFEQLTGLKDDAIQSVQEQLYLEGTQLTSAVNGRTMECGRLEIPSLLTLRQRSAWQPVDQQRLVVSEVVGDVQDFHMVPEHAGATFQAASQFNLLEMVHPGVSPEAGIARYEFDRTQGPACAIACGAGTIYRNYFVPLGQQTGQTEELKVDCLAEIGTYFGNNEQRHWQMRNGYALASEQGLRNITQHIQSLPPSEYRELQGLLQVGIQWDTEVTISPIRQKVTQVYCSALPVAYSHSTAPEWEAFARLVLSATYEATLYAALENMAKTGNSLVFLTLVGGGAFGNSNQWLLEEITAVLQRFRSAPLDVRFVSYGSPNSVVRRILAGV